MLKVYNTLSGKKEEFKTNDNKVNMYVCGVTVYDLCHIGHARSLVVFDTIYRFLKKRGYHVTFVRNFTDIDDKIINRARKENIPWQDIAHRYIEAFYHDTKPLNVLSPDIEPRATDHIDEMIKIIAGLVDKGFAYEGKDGVYFNVKSFPSYGKLSHRSPEELLEGHRVEPGEGKRNPLDFALWKKSRPGEPHWDSPWGEGRPGWHIECSTMSMKYLGQSLDIHGGGLDLIFPHHENEIAQSEAYSGVEPFARYWVHNGFVQVKGEKMSKSLGNFFTIRDILSEFHPEALRLFLLSRHYRSPIDYTPEAIKESLSSLERFYFLMSILNQRLSKDPAKNISEIKKDDIPDKFIAIKNLNDNFEKAMEDDFNTARAIGCVFDALSQLSKLSLVRTPNPAWKHVFIYFSNCINDISDVLGIFGSDPDQFIEEIRSTYLEKNNVERDYVEKMVQLRDRARKERNFQEADRIRDELRQKGIIVEDYPEGSAWRILFR